MKIFKKILIANRGEIAVRIIKSAKKLGISTVAIYSEVDDASLHLQLADETYCIGKQELSDTYLNIEKIMKVAQNSGCDALHPGYGFLAENPQFVAICQKARITFIGPHVEAIKLMGNKIKARAFVTKLGIPITEGVTGTPEQLLKKAHTIAFPILVKAAAGGGGKGMRIVYEDDNLQEILEATSREAKNYFCDGSIYIEKYIEEPRHIEFQVLGDNFGKVVHLFERECTIQRRYQKIIEESPSPTLTNEIREKMAGDALSIARKVAYNSAGTIEFLVDNELNYYFLEMNTRIQVEHPVTEMVTGVDLVEEQILVAAGNPLRLKQEELSQTGHAIECRIYAEDPTNNFIPSPGKITLYKEPSGENIRIDTGIEKAVEIKSFFDPLISKQVVWGYDRQIAINKSVAALKNYTIHGIKTNILYLLFVLQHQAFAKNKLSTKFCDLHTGEILSDIEAMHKPKNFINAAIAFTLYDLNLNSLKNKRNIWEEIGYWRLQMEISLTIEKNIWKLKLVRKKNNTFWFEVAGKIYETCLKNISEHEINFRIDKRYHKAAVSKDERGTAYVSFDGLILQLKRNDILVEGEEYTQGTGDSGNGNLFAPMPGKVIKINVKAGNKVHRGTVLLVVEAMKMENNIVATQNAIIEKVNVKEGDMVDTDLQLVDLVIP